MTIIEKPDILSFSANLKPIILNSVEPVVFILKKGEKELLSQKYSAGDNQRIEIDVKDIIHASLRYQLRESGEVYEQPELAADFTAVIDKTEVTFRVVRGGVAHLADTSTTFLQQNWLTWQPTEKKVTYHSPEFLTYYAVENCVVKLKAYFSGNDETITYASLSAGKAYTLPLQYAVVSGKFKDKLPGAYDVWVESTAGERLTYVQRYRAEAAKSLQEDWVLFENSLGGLDCFRAYGEKSLEAKHTHNVAELDEETEEYRVDTERIYTKHTGYLSKEETNWLLDFFPSTGKYVFDGHVLRKITVTESSAKKTNKFDPCGYSFSYKFADAVPLLNLARAEQPVEVLNIEIPEVGNFTIPPRLAEVGRLPLSEGVLFPVQNPYAEDWGTTTMGAIAQVVGQWLGDAAGSGGGVGHQHKNIDLLNLLALAGKYLTVGGEKVHAGYADEAGRVKDGDKRYVRKDIADTLTLLLTLLGGAEFGETIDSMTAGSGTLIDKHGRIQTDRIEVRHSMTVMEMIINRLQAMESDYSFSESGTIEQVELQSDTTYRLWLQKRWENDFTALRVNDIIYGQSLDFNKGPYTYYTSWMRVLHVDTAGNYVDVVLYPDTEVPGGKNYPPIELMVIAHRGNPEDKNRQAYWYLSSNEHCICMLDGVTKPVLEESNYSIIVGRLKNLSIFDNLPINYQQSYVYCRGIATQDLMQIDYQGTVSKTEVNRMFWSLEEAKTNPYLNTNEVYHVVSHYGCEWMCLISNTLQEPKYGCTDWAMIRGNPEFTVDLGSSEGWYFDVENFSTTLQVTGELYNQDVTAHIRDADVSWSRDTGDVAEDNAWTTAHAGIGKVLKLTTEDLGPNYIHLTNCKFKATALLRDGQDETNVLQASMEVKMI